MTAPSAPTAVSATATTASPTTVTVQWTAPDGAAPSRYDVTVLPPLHVYTTTQTTLDVPDLVPGATYTFAVVAVNDDGASPPESATVTIADTGPQSWGIAASWVFVALAAAGAALFLVAWGLDWGSASSKEANLSFGFAFALLLGASLVLTLLGTFGTRTRRYGMWQCIVGADRRLSTSKLTTFLWTLLVFYMLAYLVGRSWFDHIEHLFDTVAPNGEKPASGVSWDDYLVLLGGPFAALATAKGLVTAKVQNGTLQKTVVDDGTPKVRQALTGDDGNADLVDTQYLLFNAIAIAYVIFGFVSTSRTPHPGLPDIPGLLLSLTSVSAATYVLNKSLQQNTPTVASIQPRSARPGDGLVVAGTNFVPDGTSRAPTVTIGGVLATVDGKATSGRIVTEVPLGIKAGTADVVVTTAALVASEPRTVEVLRDQPVITGIRPAAPKASDSVTITGRGFLIPADRVRHVSVLRNGVPVSARVTTDASGSERVTCHLPPGLSTGAEVTIVVETARQTKSDEAKVTIA